MEVMKFPLELNTVYVRNLNVRISDDTEIQTNLCSVHRCSDFERSVLFVFVLVRS